MSSIGEFLALSALQYLKPGVGDPGRNPVACGELLGHIGKETEKSTKVGLRFKVYVYQPELNRVIMHVKPAIATQVRMAV